MKQTEENNRQQVHQLHSGYMWVHMAMWTAAACNARCVRSNVKYVQVLFVETLVVNCIHSGNFTKLHLCNWSFEEAINLMWYHSSLFLLFQMNTKYERRSIWKMRREQCQNLVVTSLLLTFVSTFLEQIVKLTKLSEYFERSFSIDWDFWWKFIVYSSECGRILWNQTHQAHFSIMVFYVCIKILVVLFLWVESGFPENAIVAISVFSLAQCSNSLMVV